MNKKHSRQIVFVCNSVLNGELISKIVPADSLEEASSLFLKEQNIVAKEVLGPFYKKRVKVLEDIKVIRFSNENKKAIYDNWLVNALLLKEPENKAYLIFIKRIDNEKIPFPKGTVIVPISDLRFQ